MPTVRNVTAHIDWCDYTGREAILPVCVRSPAMQGRNLIASLKALSEKVDDIHLIIIDTLDRYNFDMNAPLCRARGQTWYNNNLPIIENYLSIESTHHWDDILSDSTYEDRLKSINTLYAKSREVRDMIDRNAMYFVTAREAREQNFDRDKEFQNSVSYMIEEYAGTAVYGEKLSYLPEAYWGIYVGNPYFFEQFNQGMHKLILPQTLPIHINRLSAPYAGEVYERAA